MEKKLLVDFSSKEWTDKDWLEVTDCIAKACGIQDAKIIVMKVQEDLGYNRTEAHTTNLVEWYACTDTMSTYLEELVDNADCKNGCQLYQNEDGTIYFCISGANFYDKDGNYAGTNEVRVYFKEFVW